MSNFDEPTIEGLLTRTGLYAQAEKEVRRFAQSNEVNDRVSYLAEELGCKRSPWSAKDADRLLAYSGKELWVTIRPTPTGVTAHTRGITPARFGKLRGDGVTGKPKELTIELRGKERYG